MGVIGKRLILSFRYEDVLTPTDRGGIEGRVKTARDSDIMMTLMTQGGRVRGSQGSCGCGGYFRPWGSLIWLLGKPPSLADGESHREGSCPAMTDGETNGLWNSISCEIHSEGGVASTIIQSHASTTVWVRLRPQQTAFSWLVEPQIALLIEIYP